MMVDERQTVRQVGTPSAPAPVEALSLMVADSFKWLKLFLRSGLDV